MSGHEREGVAQPKEDLDGDSAIDYGGPMRYTPKYIDRSHCYVVYDRDLETNAALSHTDIPLTLADRAETQALCDELNGDNHG